MTGRLGPVTNESIASELALHSLEAQPDGGSVTENTSQQLEPVIVRRHEGEPRWWFGGLAEIKATSPDTGGRMTLVEVTVPPNLEAPLHVHYRDDEAFWILEGDITFQVGDTTIEASAGDYVFA